MEEEQVVFEPGSWQDNFMKMSEQDKVSILPLSKPRKGYHLSDDARERIAAVHRARVRPPMGGAQKKQIGESVKRSCSERIWTEDNSKNRSEANSKRWTSYTKEERQDIKDRNSNSNREHWEGLSNEAYEVWLEATIAAQKKAKLEGKGHIGSPNADEFFLGIYLEKRFPGEWAFNGSYNQGITIGRKVPDFVNTNGKKEVVEMFGHQRHPDWHEKAWKEHYAKYGYKCTIVWEEYTDSDSDLDRIFGVSLETEGGSR